MEAVIKIGGSLAGYPDALKTLCRKLSEMGQRHRLLIVPGGGEFVDVVRVIDKRFQLSPSISHKMAILGMEQFGLLLSELIPNAIPITSLGERKICTGKKGVHVFSPSKMMFREKALDASWDVTSDSIAAFVACRLHAKNLILVKSVDGLFSEDPEKNSNAKLLHRISISALSKLPRESVVDNCLPRLLMNENVYCYIVNGLFPERIVQILEGNETVCTLITS